MAFDISIKHLSSSEPSKKVEEFYWEDYNDELTSTYGVQSPDLYIARVNEFTGSIYPFGSELIRWDKSRECFVIKRSRQLSS